MSQLGSLLDTLYRNDRPAPSKEKTAEDKALAALRGDDEAVSTETAEENPYANMSTEELAALALSLEAGQTGAGEVAEGDETVKLAQEKMGGEIMAHAAIHEFGLIKQAMAEGKCRVCKENPRDIDGSSICSGCLQGDE